MCLVLEVKCICLNDNKQLSRFQRVFVQLENCICQNGNTYLSKWQSVFAAKRRELCRWRERLLVMKSNAGRRPRLAPTTGQSGRQQCTILFSRFVSKARCICQLFLNDIKNCTFDLGEQGLSNWAMRKAGGKATRKALP